MKRKLVALLAAALLLTGCSATESSLLDWVKEAGMATVIQGTSAALGEVATKLEGLGTSPEDIRTMVTALQASAGAIATQVAALAAEPTSNDPNYERLRQDLISSMETYIAAAQSLDAAEIIESGNIAATTAVISALTGISEKLVALSDYLANNGDSAVGSA